MSQSLMEQMAALSPVELAKRVSEMPEELAAELCRSPWYFAARPEQLPPPGDWTIWLILAGRGWGKSRTGSEWLAERVLSTPISPDGMPTDWAVIAETFSDTRKICIEGPSGLLNALSRRGLQEGVHYYYNRASWELIFAQGQRVMMLGADKNVARGYNFSGVWCDEIAKWRTPEESWSAGIAPSLRIGKNPQAVITTTPKRLAFLSDWMSRDDGSVVVTRGSTFDNASNLSKGALKELSIRYEGTRLGRQELYGEMLQSVGTMLQVEWFPVVDFPPECETKIRMWDLAATEPNDANPDPDFTAGFLVGKRKDGFTVLDGQRFRLSPGKVEQRILDIAESDGPNVEIYLEQEPGASGVSIVAHYKKLLAGKARVHGYRPSGDKVTRTSVILAGAAEQGRVNLASGPWVRAFLDECADFPNGDHDDQIDVVTAAVDVLDGLSTVDALYTPISESKSSAWRM